MKIKMDLLPSRYKCLPRDYLGMAIAGASAVLAIVVIIMTFVVKRVEYQRERREIESPLIEFQQQIQALDNELQSIERRTQGVQFDTMLQNQLVREMQQFNEIRTGFKWSQFFHVMEKATPSRVWIKDFTFRPAGDFTMRFELSCEAADGIIPIRFYRNLLQGPAAAYFSDVTLGESRFSDTTLTVQFTISFNFYAEVFEEVAGVS